MSTLANSPPTPLGFQVNITYSCQFGVNMHRLIQVHITLAMCPPNRSYENFVNNVGDVYVELEADMLVPQRSTPRWKEWIPLISQQQRLRNLIQVYAYNVPWSRGCSFYFTLHLTSMSPPFYTSEKASHQHPRWMEMEFTSLESSVNTSATGVVIRLWRHVEGQNLDHIILVWGLHFSGLVYLGPTLNANPTLFNENTIVLHLQGGFFTDQSCLKELPRNALVRNFSVMLAPHEVKPSYSVSLLLRLRDIQQSIKKQTQRSEVLRERISAGGVSAADSSLARESNPTLRKLLSRNRPKPQLKQETLAIRCELEVLRFRVALLRQEKFRKIAQVESLLKQRDLAAVENSDRSCVLTARYQSLHKETEQLKESHRQFTDMREIYLLKSAQLNFRRKQLMSQLSLIYPVVQTGGKYTICGVHLPNSEDLSPDDVSVSVALGFVAHLVQMVSIFLQVPLRYPIIHFGSRSKIIDYISDKIPDKEREFPLFSRGKDKLQFHYGVFLLNKDIAQLRWLVGFPTNDLRATLHNVYHLLHLNQFPMLDSHHRSMSGSSLDVIGSPPSFSPIGSVLSTPSSSQFGFMSPSPGQVHTRSRASKSLGSSDALFRSSKMRDAYTGSPSARNIAADSIASCSNLSFSLDTGLDEYEEVKKAKGSTNSTSSMSSVVPKCLQLAHVGSEPNLVIHSHHNSSTRCDVPFSQANALIQPLQAGNGGSLEFDKDVHISRSTGLKNTLDYQRKTEFSLVTERIVELVDSCEDFGNQHQSPPYDTAHPQPIPFSANNMQAVLSADDLLTRDQQEASSLAEATRSNSEHITNASGALDSSGPKFNLDAKKTDVLHVSSGDLDVDIGTDALVDISTSCQLSPVALQHEVTNAAERNVDLQSDVPTSHPIIERKISSEETGMECIGIEERVLVDNLFANVTSRTEALASGTTSFNLMSSRHGSC